MARKFMYDIEQKLIRCKRYESRIVIILHSGTGFNKYICYL